MTTDVFILSHRTVELLRSFGQHTSFIFWLIRTTTVNCSWHLLRHNIGFLKKSRLHTSNRKNRITKKLINHSPWIWNLLHNLFFTATTRVKTVRSVTWELEKFDHVLSAKAIKKMAPAGGAKKTRRGLGILLLYRSTVLTTVQVTIVLSSRKNILKSVFSSFLINKP